MLASILTSLLSLVLSFVARNDDTLIIRTRVFDQAKLLAEFMRVQILYAYLTCRKDEYFLRCNLFFLFHQLSTKKFQ